jgi:hypothetical protein
VVFSWASYWIFIMPIFYVACKNAEGGLRKMNAKDKTIDFLKVVEGIKNDQATAQKEAFKQLRIFYLKLLESGFTMEEAMAYLAALTRNLSNEEKGDDK